MQVETPEKKTGLNQNLFKVAGFLALFAVGGLVGFWLAKSLINQEISTEFPAEYKLLVLPIIIIVLFLSIAIHEAGHLLGGLMAGFTFSLFIVGPFMFVREGTRIRFKWNKGLGFFGGLASCMPKDTHNLMKRFLLLVSGGPLASLLTSVIAFGFIKSYALETHEGILQGFLISSLFHTFMWISLGIFLIASVPMKSAGFYTDGARIINLLKGGALAKLDTILMTTITLSASGTRPSQLDTALLTEASELPVTSVFKVYADIYLYFSALDSGNLPEAEIHLSRAITNQNLLPKFYDGVLVLEKAFLTSITSQDAPAARLDFSQVKPNNFIPPHTFLRVETAILLAENNSKKATEKATEALAQLHKAIDKGVAVWEKEWLESVIKNAEITKQV